MYVVRRLALALALVAIAVGILLVSDLSGRSRGTQGPGDRAAKSTYQISIVAFGQDALTEDGLRGIADGLQQAGLATGITYQTKVRNAQADMATLNSIVDAAVQDKPDLIMTISTPTLQAALNRVKGIPVVFTNTADPLAAGAGTSFEEHNPMFTGICTASDFERSMQVLKQLLPRATKIGTLFAPAEVNSVVYKDRLKAAAATYGLQLEAVPVNQSSDISDAVLMLCSKQPDAVCQVSDNITAASLPSMIQTCRRLGVPVQTFVSAFVRDGALLAVARDFHQAGMDAAGIAVSVLAGANPADIPFRFVSKTLVVLNQDTANAFGITIPDDLRAQADEIVGK
jgi:ABC-type uncharacterized transport system substrate-binding protein